MANRMEWIKNERMEINMDSLETIFSVINGRISILNAKDNSGIRYYEDYESNDKAYEDGYMHGGLAELEYIKRQVEYLLK